MQLRIKSGSKKPCTTEVFKTELRSGTAKHTFLSADSEFLGDCDGYGIINGKAEIKVVSADSNDVVRVNEVNFNTNGRFIPSISCEGGEAINGTGVESHLWQECKTKNAISKLKTHTSSLGGAGTDAGITMTFMLINKESGKIEEQCEKLKAEHFNNHGNDRERTEINIYHISNLGLCQQLLGDIAEGFWNDGKFQLSVELFNDGKGLVGPAWHFDLFKIYFMGDYESERVVRCTVNGDVWLERMQTKVINCELYQPRQPLRSLEALGVHTCDLEHAGSSSENIRLRFCSTEELAKNKTGHSDGVDCCEMNRFGYHNSVDLNRGETLKIDGNQPLDNGMLDDGGDKLGQCEGFEITGSDVYVTVQNPYHGGWCLNGLDFYGNSKYSQLTDDTPFTSCHFTPIWSENDKVYRQDGDDWMDQNAEHHRDIPFICEMGKSNTIMKMEIKVCDKDTAGTEAQFTATFTNWNHGTCSTTIEGSLKPNEFVALEISRECKSMDAGNELKLMIANHNENANDDVCLEDIFLNVASTDGTQKWRCTIDGNAHFAMDFQGENTGLPLVCAP